jgi:hypothetical protein
MSDLLEQVAAALEATEAGSGIRQSRVAGGG